ncbi:MAG: hypothetical protein ACRD1B_02185 [Thermoanaerobaculia bacterium]
MNEGEKDRRLASLVHMAFLASIGVYLILIVVARRGGAAPTDPTGRTQTLAFCLLAIAAGEFSWASWLGRRHLTRGSGDAVSRVRSFFYLRFGAAEAAAIFGLMLGFLGGGAVAIGLLFALSAAALLAAAPSPGRWAAALSEAAGRPP